MPRKPATAPLAEYAARRRFSATPEPAPGPAPGHGPLLFTVQMHSATRLHWDFRLECDGVLKSWALPKGPSLDPDDKRLAVPTEDHPYGYASFEGVIPEKQYGAGPVIVWDCGVYSPEPEPRGAGGLLFHDRRAAEARVRAGLAAGKLSFQLRGLKLKGSFALVRTRDPKAWLLIKHRDAHAQPAGGAAQDRSVLSAATVREVGAADPAPAPAERLAPAGRPVALPARLPPMLAELGQAAFNDPAWLWEPKLDGYRALAHFDRGGLRLLSRRGQDYTRTFPALAAELAAQAVPGTVLDGEIVAMDAQGRPSFNALQNRAGLRTAAELAAADRDAPVIYYAFDLPFFAGVDLRDRPYAERRRYLAQCLLPGPRVQPVHASADGVALHRAAVEAGFEGVVGKRLDGRWLAGKRSGAWLKVKPVQSAEFVIGGYAPGKGARARFGALLVGVHENGALHYVSQVGTGFDEAAIDELLTRLDALRQPDCPFARRPPQSAAAVWVQPRLVAELKYHELTPDGSLRAPVFLRLRHDIDPRDVKRSARAAAPAARRRPPPGRATRGDEAAVLAQLDTARSALTLEVGGHRIALSNLDRVYWPADRKLKTAPVTKRDLLRYLARVAPVMLPHLADRPLTMIRMPGGIGGQRFFQKHWEGALPDFVERVTIFSASNARSGEYLLCNNLPTLLWLGQAGTLEFHVWHSRVRPGPDSAIDATDFGSSERALEASILIYPDWVVFDIDPYIYSGREARGAEPELNTAAFDKGKEVAFALRELLQSMSLDSVVKTSGKTGLHVFVPIRRSLDFAAARQVSEQVGRHLMRLHPRDITMDWSIPKRTGKIFMDYNMNVRGKTLNAAYSPRGVAGAPVSMPLGWKELARAHPLDFRIDTAPARIARTGDRWAGALADKQDLARVLQGT